MTLAITALLAVWLWKAADRLTGLALGLIVGGALGNAWDRYAYGAVADFFHFYMDTERWGRVSWYVFNIADVAIVAGVGASAVSKLLRRLRGRRPVGSGRNGEVAALPPNRQDTKAG